MGKTLSDLTTLTQQHLENSLQKSTSTSYSNFSQFLTLVKEELRESIQKITEGQICTIISKLKQNKPLTDSEIRLLRIWIVGDAESYITKENNLNDWIQEMKRIVGEIQQYRDEQADLDKLLSLQGLVLDLHRNLQDVTNFLAEKERIDRFTESTREIDSQEAGMLATMLERKLNSSQS